MFKFIEWLYKSKEEGIVEEVQETIQCPACDSQNIIEQEDTYLCEDCGMEFKEV